MSRLTVDMLTADEYFIPHPSFNNYKLRHRANGTFLETAEEDQGTLFTAIPLFNDISGYSPSGLDYKKLGCSFHSQDVENITSLLLST